MLPTCHVRAIVLDSVGGEPVAKATVTYKLDQYDISNGYVAPGNIVTTTDENGECYADLWPNSFGERASKYNVRIMALGRTFRTTCVVPDAPTADLHLIAER